MILRINHVAGEELGFNNGKSQNIRRARKPAFTRALNAGQLLLDSTRQLPEVRDAFEELKSAPADWIAKHEEYMMFLEDEEYPAAENWMEKCNLKYVNFSMRVNYYFDKPYEDKEKNPASVVVVVETDVHGFSSRNSYHRKRGCTKQHSRYKERLSKAPVNEAWKAENADLSW